jgi:aspartyl-tRNA(Asn)/glutamyl-tRNA(Gln) amidotransferase subunit A
MEFSNLTIHELSKLLKKREISVKEILEGVFQQIYRFEKKINAYVTLTRDYALKQAEEADKKLKKNEGGTLTGIPIAIKDLICTKGIKTTCSSKILYNFIPPYDATVILRIKEEGAVFIGKTNMDEFAMGSSTETSYFGITRNPWDINLVPGGSSGGSAAAVSADECICALGSDTGGSIRQPAAFCGIVGLKPTYGLVSRYGLIAFASSLDQIGPMTKDVEDCALLLNCIAGHDPKDSTSLIQKNFDYTKDLKKDLKGIKIGLPKEYFIEGIDEEISKTVKDALLLMEKNGAQIVEISLPHTEYAVATYYLIAPAEASSNLARYDGVKYGYRAPKYLDLLDMYTGTKSEGFGSEVKRRIMLGTYALSAGYYDAYYKKASQVRTLIKEDFDKAFKLCDVIFTPTTPTPAFKIGEKIDDPLKMYLNDVFTIPISLAGLPAISIPCGFTKDGKPIGLQIISAHLKEEKLLQVAYNYEQNTDWHKRKPALLETKNEKA